MLMMTLYAEQKKRHRFISVLSLRHENRSTTVLPVSNQLTFSGVTSVAHDQTHHTMVIDSTGKNRRHH